MPKKGGEIAVKSRASRAAKVLTWGTAAQLGTASPLQYQAFASAVDSFQTSPVVTIINHYQPLIKASSSSMLSTD